MIDREGAELSGVGDALRPQGPGARLRQIREAKRINLEDMAKQLRLTPQRLAQIESDDYEAMGSATFARGYLRAYARSLGIGEKEAADTLQLFESMGLESGIHSHKPRLIHEKLTQTNHKVLRRFGLLVVVVLIVLAGFWWHNRNVLAAKTEAEAAAPPTEATSGGVPLSVNAQAPSPIPLQATPAPGTNTATPATAPQEPLVNNTVPDQSAAADTTMPPPSKRSSHRQQ